MVALATLSADNELAVLQVTEATTAQTHVLFQHKIVVSATHDRDGLRIILIKVFPSGLHDGCAAGDRSDFNLHLVQELIYPLKTT